MKAINRNETNFYTCIIIVYTVGQKNMKVSCAAKRILIKFIRLISLKLVIVNISIILLWLFKKKKKTIHGQLEKIYFFLLMKRKYHFVLTTVK